MGASEIPAMGTNRSPVLATHHDIQNSLAKCKEKDKSFRTLHDKAENWDKCIFNLINY
jgi:hypothetical protein